MVYPIKSILNPSQRPVTAVTVLGLLVLATVGVKAHVWRNSAPAAVKQEQLLPTVSGPVQIVRFTVYDAGIFPREARVAHGRVVISLVDYTGGTEGLVVEREVGNVREQAGRARRTGAHWRGRQELNLSPGTYRLYDASRPENSATLVVEP